MQPYHCEHVRLKVLRYPLLRLAMLHRGEVVFAVPCVIGLDCRPRTSPHMPPVAGHCPECGAACGWRREGG